jgi:hypothetical protein
MGTRHLIAVYVDGQPRIAQYGQWDGYPEGQGATVLKFLRSLKSKGPGSKRDTFIKRLRGSRWATQENFEAINKAIGIDDSGWMNMDQAAKFKQGWPQLSRDMGGDILQFICDAEVPEGGFMLKNSLDFAADGLFCEFAYVIDFDQNVFEVYKGFNGGQGGRFADMPRSNPEYAPVGLVKTYNLDILPTANEFLSDLKEPEEDE